MSKSTRQVALDVAEAIQAHPDHFDMDSWAIARDDDHEEPNYCNTNFCIAGWALAVSGYKLKKSEHSYGEINFIHPETGDVVSPDNEGAKLLGLQRQGLFFNQTIDVQQAVELLHILADQGEESMYDRMEEMEDYDGSEEWY